ncbi:AIPR family protein [Arthrobacter sp. FW305-BF8]|uniref:AIPR family protein n=1 Tax=Arthrobacter sp. FW305-BF8 TaxID=2879617 RepID=UPI001F3C4E45|nr:AIPR family protein [Arthrobacter sp. FW305-BF8]UKA55496.1 AIPR family protein [Arthrobacter sp. FW305-BF8]
MTVNDFHQRMMSDVQARADSDADFPSRSFMSIMAEKLADVDEVENLQVLHYEGTGSRNRSLLIDGYDLYDTDDPGADRQIALAVMDWHPGSELATLTTTEARKKLNALQSFLSDAVQQQLETRLEDSSDEYQLARELRQRGASVSRYRLYLISNAQVSASMKVPPAETINGIPVDFHVWDLSRLLQVEESASGRSEVEIDLSGWLEDGLPALSIQSEEAEFETYLAAVPGDLLADLYGQYGSRLLEGNVRSFLSNKVLVNRGIRATIQSEPDMFLAYNNGLTATATSVAASRSGSHALIKTIKNLQIVNGGQTTASLYNARRDLSPKPNLKDISVQLKLIVVHPEESETLVPKISKYANTQNRVNPADFFSNSPFHRRLESISRRLLAPSVAGKAFQTHWFYERTRGQYLNERNRGSASHSKTFEVRNPRNQVINKTDLAKYELSWAQEPHMVSRGSQKNFSAFAANVANKWDKDEAQFNDEYFKHAVAKAILFNSVRAAVLKAEWYTTGYLANIVSYAVAKLAYEVQVQGKGKVLDLDRIWLSQAVPVEVLSYATELAKAARGVLTHDDKPVVNVTEWAKKEQCWTDVKSESVPAPAEFLATLLDPFKVVEKAKTARMNQKIDSSISAQIEALNVGGETWLRVADFGKEHRILSPNELSLVSKFSNGAYAVPTESQAAKLMTFLQRVEENGFKR